MLITCRRFFFRFVVAKKGTPARELVSVKPCYIAYYPGESYFYSSSAKVQHCIIVASCTAGCIGIG